MLVDYEVTDMGFFDNYLDAEPRAKQIKGNGITNFLFHVEKFITLDIFFLQQNLLMRHGLSNYIQG